MGQTRALVHYLLRERGEAPNARLYSALILANVSPEQGSALQVAQLLREMEAEDVPLDAGLCHDVLKVLSVHVDHLLRCDILELMRHRWFALTVEGRQYVAAALLREGDLELALDALSELKAEGPGSTPPWLVEMAVDVLLEAEEVSCALDVAKNYTPSSPADTLSPAVFYALLDESSARQFLPGTVFIWNAQVQPGHLDPGAGICQHVLSAAARHGDPELATEAFRRLSALGCALSTKEYERLCQAYLRGPQPNLEAALETFAIMADSGLNPTATCMRPLYIFLTRKPELVRTALRHAVGMHEDGRAVPLPVLNTLLEVLAGLGDVDCLMHVYKAMPTFERYTDPQTPRMPFADAGTFEHVYGCLQRSADGKSAAFANAVSVWEDQRAMGIPLSSTARERLAAVIGRSGAAEVPEELQDMLAGRMGSH